MNEPKKLTHYAANHKWITREEMIRQFVSEDHFRAYCEAMGIVAMSIYNDGTSTALRPLREDLKRAEN